MSKLLSFAALGVVLAALASSSAFAQAISPTDSSPVTAAAGGPLVAAPSGLYSLSVDWLALGANPLDLANVGPSEVPLTDPPSPSGNLVVGNNPLNCPHRDFTTIQGAVTYAASGAHIMVCPGTYQEQVTIPAGTDNLTLQSQKPLQAIIQAPAVMTTPKAIVLVQAQNVKIQQFTIQGPGPACGDTLEYGVFVDNGSATIEHNHITHIRDLELGGQLCGDQNGVGVQVGRRILGATGSATVRNNQIDDYQKNGITIDNAGSSADVENNLVQGFGPSATIAQNGIQVSRGATGQVKNNTVSGNVYVGIQNASSTGILLYADPSTPPAGAVDVENNRLSANDTGVYAFQAASSSEVENNKVVNSTDDGVTVDTSDGLSVENNQVQGNDQGVGVYNTSGASLQNNQAKDNRSNGFFADTDTSGNTFQNDQASGSGTFDCRDRSIGTGTAGTANFWLNDHGDTSLPTGICH
jgi:parallel beta-helix repeat protein